MKTIVGVAFKRPGKTYSFNPDGLTLRVGDRVVVKTTQGVELGEVVAFPREVEDDAVAQPLKKVVRKANDEDVAKLERNREKQAAALKDAQEKIEEHRLPMRLVEVDQAFDGSKMTFYFTADSRVDFRELVKDLAGKFKTRIELRQVGVRDKARMVGGLGHCGKDLCCTMFLSDLNPVSIRMAKDQNLPLNPQKITGVCGRLMCCLRYEVEAYKDFKKRAPRRGACVETCDGHKGCVVEQNVLRERLKIQDENGHRMDVPLTDIKGVCDDKKLERAEPEIEAEAELKTMVEDGEPVPED
ncbi:MAG: stage 0 sporulation family protein [Actinomycetota bacterium]|nr:stage 0 sporulation family protein [Actinomycetota bacterium]